MVPPAKYILTCTSIHLPGGGFVLAMDVMSVVVVDGVGVVVAADGDALVDSVDKSVVEGLCEVILYQRRNIILVKCIRIWGIKDK